MRVVTIGRRRLAVIASVLALVLAACGSASAPSASPTAAAGPPTSVPTLAPTAAPSTQPTPATSTSPTPLALRLPQPNAGFDYQLGGAYPPPSGVTVISRDRTEAPAPGLFNICYVNGFQIQPGELDTWKTDHPDLILKDANGKIVIDPDWDEAMLDPRTPANRAALADVIGDWIAGCAAAGFDAVEVDNLDTFTRSDGLITEDDAVAQMRLFADGAHANGLAIAQKNSAEIVGRRDEMATDFAVAEECDRYSECDVYTGAYGDHVLVIEYRRRDFDKGCAGYPNLSIVLRDLDLVTAADKGYVYDAC